MVRRFIDEVDRLARVSLPTSGVSIDSGRLDPLDGRKNGIHRVNSRGMVGLDTGV